MTRDVPKWVPPNYSPAAEHSGRSGFTRGDWAIEPAAEYIEAAVKDGFPDCADYPIVGYAPYAEPDELPELASVPKRHLEQIERQAAYAAEMLKLARYCLDLAHNRDMARLDALRRADVRDPR